MLSSSLYTMLEPSKTTSPNKLFDKDCVSNLEENTFPGLVPGLLEVGEGSTTRGAVAELLTVLRVYKVNVLDGEK